MIFFLSSYIALSNWIWKNIILTLFYDQNYVNLFNLKFHPLCHTKSSFFWKSPKCKFVKYFYAMYALKLIQRTLWFSLHSLLDLGFCPYYNICGPLCSVVCMILSHNSLIQRCWHLKNLNWRRWKQKASLSFSLYYKGTFEFYKIK